MRCLSCGFEPMEPRHDQVVDLPCGLDGVTLAGATVHVCRECGETETEVPRLELVLAELTRMVAERHGRLVGREIRFLRKRLGWSSKDFARYFCVEPESVSRWESGVRRMDAFKEKMLRWLSTRGALLDDYGADMDVSEEDLPTPHEVYVVDLRTLAEHPEAAAGRRR